MKKKNLPEAFPQIATADNFFRYGVPAPPSYYAFGGETALHKFTKKKGKSMPKAAVGMAMGDDPCPPDHYWDENKGKCVPLGKSVPTREQLYDPEGPYNKWLDELNYRRNHSNYQDWVGQKRQKYIDDNFKGEKYIIDENGLRELTPEFKEFKDNNEGYKEIKNKYPYLEEGEENYHPEYKEKNFYDQNQEWDEKSKQVYDELFNTDDPNEDSIRKHYRDQMKEDFYKKQNPGKMPEYDFRNPEPFEQFYKENIDPIQMSPEQIIQGNYDNWCPCMKKKVIDFVEGKPVTQDVCVPCEEMNTAQLGGSLAGVPVYPQAQTVAQFFTPTYHNSNNAYKVGGSYIEEFPQAQRLNWGPTNYFMLQEGGDVPQQTGAIASQGMLPKMQAGNGLNGIMSKTRQDMQHYYGGNYPMFQDGGSPSDGGNTNFYSDRINTFLDKVRSRAYDALPEVIENESVQEMAQYGYSGKDMYDPSNVMAYKDAYQSNLQSGNRANRDFMRSMNSHMDFNRYANRPQGQSAAKYGVAMRDGGSLPQAKDGLEWFPEYNLEFPKVKKFDPYAIDETTKQDWKTVNIGGVNYPVGANDEVYFNRPMNYNPNATYSGGYNNYFQSPYGRDYMVDWSNATMAQLTGQALKDAKITGAETLTRRALLPGNRNAGVRLYFNGYGQPVAAPDGTTPAGGNTTTNPSGTNTTTGGDGTNQVDPGRQGFFGRMFGNKYNQHKFDVSQTDSDTNVDYTKLRSTINPEKYSEYQALLNPNKANRVTNRMQRIGDKVDRMYQYQNMKRDLDKHYYENDMGEYNEGRLYDPQGFSNREKNRVNRLADRYNRIASNNFRERYTAPVPQKAYGGSLPRADYGIPPMYNPANFNPELFNPNFNSGPLELPTMEQALERSRYPEGSRFSNTFLGKTTTYDKPIAEGMVAPIDFSKDPTAATGKDSGFFVDILQGRKKKQRDPNFPIALTKFAANKIENALSPAKEEFARSTRADQVYGVVPTTSGSRGDYVMNTPAGQFFRPDDMNPWGKKNTGFNMPFAQYGGDQENIMNGLKEGDEVYLTESQIQDIIKRGGKLSYL